MNSKIGDIKISDDVIASIVGLAVSEVEGIDSMVGNYTKEKVAKSGIKNSSKGVKVVIEDNTVSAEVYVIIKYGFPIPALTAAVQERIKSAVESMTGLSVSTVNVHITGINVPEEH